MTTHVHRCVWILSWGVGLSLAGTALAQDAPTSSSVTRSAADAFGERVGVDQVGLYNENQTRGFDLFASSGAFRLDGFYLSPAAGLPESIIQSQTVQVGIAATALDLASPTGVITYRLREPEDHDALHLTAGSRSYTSLHLEALGTVTSNDRAIAAVGHVLFQPHQRRATGRSAQAADVGLVTRWRPDSRTSIRVFGSYTADCYHGDIGVRAIGPGVPPPLRPRRDYGPEWAKSQFWDLNAGVLAERSWDGWTAAASAIWSEHHARRSDISVLTIDAAGAIAGTLYFRPPLRTTAASGEAKVARAFSALGAGHRVGLALRMRRTRNGTAPSIPFSLGRFTVATLPEDGPEPTLPEGLPKGEDRVTQQIVSGTYGFLLDDRMQVRLGVHRSLYQRSARAADQQLSSERAHSWLYSASTVWQPNRHFRAFASYVTGLEDSGTAPDVATNRGAVLPPVTASQVELGGRYAVTPELGLIIAGFQIRKPIYGLRADAFYAPIGTVRHRGIEMSLTGRLLAGTNVVIGANFVSPKLSGEWITARTVARTAPGVSRFNATLGIEQRFADSLSGDAYLLYEGSRLRDGISDAVMPGIPFATLGARYKSLLRGTPISLRAQIVNLLDRHAYYATPYGTLSPMSPRTYRLLLSVDL